MPGVIKIIEAVEQWGYSQKEVATGSACITRQ
jgi:hypothetical protein